MGQALYRKHRPKSLKEVVGQEHITTTLAQALKQGRLSHAYLFTGPRGTGKTSVARILAHEINGFDYTSDNNHLDIIEIDAASNRRIDEIRELRDKVYIAPTTGKYKVYIIDEVHMLTKEAFNALLKTLEEPPAHAVFILATTEIYKLPETIISRTQRFTFKPVEKVKVINHLKHIAKQEKVSITDEALELIAEHGEGSFRDSISLLDQASNRASKVDGEEVRSLLGLPPAQTLERLASALQDGRATHEIVGQLEDMYGQGYRAATIAKQLGEKLRRLYIDRPEVGKDQLLGLLTQLIDVPVSHDPERFLEIVLLKYLPTDNNTSVKPPKEVIKAKQPKIKTSENKTIPEKKEKEATREMPTKPVKTTSKSTVQLDQAAWNSALAELKKKYNTLYSIARMAQPSFDMPGELKLSFAFQFHYKRVNDAKNRDILSQVLSRVTGEEVIISCIHDKDVKPPQISEPALESNQPSPPPEALNTISNIFGGGEVLES